LAATSLEKKMREQRSCLRSSNPHKSIVLHLA
jgi:hypothetical protein